MELLTVPEHGSWSYLPWSLQKQKGQRHDGISNPVQCWGEVGAWDWKWCLDRNQQSSRTFQIFSKELKILNCWTYTSSVSDMMAVDFETWKPKREGREKVKICFNGWTLIYSSGLSCRRLKYVLQETAWLNPTLLTPTLLPLSYTDENEILSEMNTNSLKSDEVIVRGNVLLRCWTLNILTICPVLRAWLYN